jgi:fibronectin type 3 domain-containing protein
MRRVELTDTVIDHEHHLGLKFSSNGVEFQSHSLPSHLLTLTDQLEGGREGATGW